MEFRSLQYFLMAAREENITKAANLLHLTQPTLSRSIMQLEEELGVKLFTRSNHNIILTEDGMLLKRRAKELVSLAEKTKQDFQRGDVQLIGEISIGSGEFRSTRYLSKMIASFREKHPLIRYQIYSGNSENIKERIERGILDFGLMMEPIDVSKYEYISMPVRRPLRQAICKMSSLFPQEVSICIPKSESGLENIMIKSRLLQVVICSTMKQFWRKNRLEWYWQSS